MLFANYFACFFFFVVVFFKFFHYFFYRYCFHWFTSKYFFCLHFYIVNCCLLTDYFWVLFKFYVNRKIAEKIEYVGRHCIYLYINLNTDFSLFIWLVKWLAQWIMVEWKKGQRGVGVSLYLPAFWLIDWVIHVMK